MLNIAGVYLKMNMYVNYQTRLVDYKSGWSPGV
jgi:hypothetical protein